ncbi:uncharacterized protein LOC111702695 isoform X2 [Eurytemora carolleeae]|uniref:uncharacterized protein LOC111702695 isoform X2 n=1 Tax=Eurytemora carolleeae TaxID=1294199 RepID=UPI000C771B54|nr:uncharacterized protein LOC111702695 isoform X2 [Eurytemora carolleeae]|eukprot:XP_023330229.1 uncharacterized protein LOC111702695 isoform X2 [Eurytemora affinis]
MEMSVKFLAILTVLTANIVLIICLCLLIQAPACRSPCAEPSQTQILDTRHTLAVICTLILCLLVLITASLDNISWWNTSFPDTFMSTTQTNSFLDRLLVTNPGCKVTIQQDFFVKLGTRIVPKTRRKAHEMFKPNQWFDSTKYSVVKQINSGVLKLRLEVSPVNKEAKEDLDKFIQELILQNSSGYKIPQIRLENKLDSILLPLSSSLHKIMGEPVRIFVFRDTRLWNIVCPTLFSLKKILFTLILFIPVLGTILSLILAENTRQLKVRKRFSRRRKEDEDQVDKENLLIPFARNKLPRLARLFNHTPGRIPLLFSTQKDGYDDVEDISPTFKSDQDMNERCFPMEPWQDEIKIAIPNLDPFHEEPKLELTLDSPPPYSGLDNSILPVPPSYSDLLHTAIDRDKLYTARETDNI